MQFNIVACTGNYYRNYDEFLRAVVSKVVP